ncbi:hypothetical protein [Nocardioides exalbidus]|uniref:hypothetical protein n=1 Tax=Nocardioides exalbidus TaxID=402596 RepID=UPI00111528B7|nr:hypothetical protein [Nocardioides exalbidus]
MLQIDWRDLKSRISEHIATVTGVIHVRVPDAQAAETVFIRTLTEHWINEHWDDDEVVVVHVDPSDPATHHVAGLAQKIANACGLSSPEEVHGAPLIEIMKDLRARGDIEVRDNDIRVVVNQYKGFDSADPLEVLRAGLDEFLVNRKLVIVFRDVQLLSERSRVTLCRELWKNCLADFADSGVMALFLYASDCGLDIPDGTGFPPPATTVIDLPVRIGPDDQPDAIDDVADIALGAGWFVTQPEAHAFARGLVIGAESVRWVHTRLRVFGALQSGSEPGGSHD